MLGSRYLYFMLTLAEFELRKLKHDSTQIGIRGVQPALWLLVFGETFANLRSIPTGDFSYIQFITPGVLAQSVMFVAIFYGIMLVWERDVGLLNKLLSSPAPRSAIVLGKALSAGVRAIVQAIVVFAIALLIRVPLNVGFAEILGVVAVIVLAGMCFSCLSMCLVPIFRTRERMMGIGQAITMPLFFTSNAIYPISIMPPWLRVIATLNPLSYVVDAIRALLVTGDFQTMPLDIGVMAVATVIFASIAAVFFRRILD